MNLPHPTGRTIADRVFAALERMSARRAQILAYTPAPYEGLGEQALRLRAEAAAEFRRWIARASSRWS